MNRGAKQEKKQRYKLYYIVRNQLVLCVQDKEDKDFPLFYSIQLKPFNLFS